MGSRCTKALFSTDTETEKKNKKTVSRGLNQRQLEMQS